MAFLDKTLKIKLKKKNTKYIFLKYDLISFFIWHLKMHMKFHIPRDK